MLQVTKKLGHFHAVQDTFSAEDIVDTLECSGSIH